MSDHERVASNGPATANTTLSEVTKKPSWFEWAVIGSIGLMIIAAIVAVVDTNSAGTASSSYSKTACNTTALTFAVDYAYQPHRGMITTYSCDHKYALAAYEIHHFPRDGSLWGVAVLTNATGAWKIIAGGTVGTCVAAPAGTTCAGNIAPNVPISRDEVIKLVAAAGLLYKSDGSVVPPDAVSQQFQNLTCVQRAVLPYVSAQAVSIETNGSTVVTGHHATLHCGGPDDFHFDTSATPATVTLAPGAFIVILDPTQDFAPMLATPPELKSYVEENPDGNIFRVTGHPGAATGLYAMFHP